MPGTGSLRRMEHPPDTLRLELPELPCRIGILPGENESPQPVRVIVTLELDLGPVMASGDLSDGVDYAPLHGALVRTVTETKWTLLEGLAAALMECALAPAGIRAATVELVKVRPPLGSHTGPVTLTFRRESR